jgi:hypothetical protein
VTVNEEKTERDDANKVPRSGIVLEWVKILLPVLVSWPTVALIVAVLFYEPLGGLIDRFSHSTQGKAELGPLKIELGPPVLPPEYRERGPQPSEPVIDLSTHIGRIGDTGPEGTTVGFALAYTIQAAVRAGGRSDLDVSARGIYTLAKRFDEFPGEDYEGSSLSGGLQAARSVGVYSAKEWPYAAKAMPSGVKPIMKVKSFTQASSITEILDSLRADKVVAASILVTSDFDKPSEDGRVILRLPLRQLGQKGIAIVGYNPNTAEFKFANDWGAGWGAQGYGLIKDTDLAKIIKDGYTVDL